MTTAELDRIITKSPLFDWCKNIQATFNFDYINIQTSLTGFSALHAYVNQQIKGWKETINAGSSRFSSCLDYFITIDNSISAFINNCLVIENPVYHNFWYSIQHAINDTIRKPFPYDTPHRFFLMDVEKKLPAYLDGAIHFIFGTEINNISNKNILIGAILAYEFSLKDHTEITERRNAEKASISSIRNSFFNYLSESEREVQDLIRNTNNNFQQHVSLIENQTKEQSTVFQDWFKRTQEDEWGTWHNKSIEKIKELESTYKEKLKLEEPAKYWSNRAITLKKEGWRTMYILIALVLISCITLAIILWIAPESIYASWFEKDKSAAIRWSVVYITLISFMAFCIRSLTKVMFSSFHIARDCEERHTLTYFYLALLKDSKVGDEQKQLIMQSLFSRADTGLLKEDSSPTMPSDSLKNMFIK